MPSQLPSSPATPAPPNFESFFSGPARDYLLAAIRLALAEDGPDLTSLGLFAPPGADREDMLLAELWAKEDLVTAGLPMLSLVLEESVVYLADADPAWREAIWTVDLLVTDGCRVGAHTVLARIEGPAVLILKAERVFLNLISHCMGVATLTARYVAELAGTRTRLLDTRKTLPGLRFPAKYAVRCGGGLNHRMDLAEMLMLKDNHVDQAGSILEAVQTLRAAYAQCPPIEVECRTLAEIDEAVTAGADRIMLDNFALAAIPPALARIPDDIESEISGSVSLENIRELAHCGADYISVGRLTHSAPAADLSLRLKPR